MEKLTRIELTPDSISQITNIICTLFENDSQDYYTTLERFLSDNTIDREYYFYEQDDQKVGFVCVHKWHPIPKPDKTDRLYWHIADFHIFREFRSDGLGTRFLNSLISLAQTNNVEKIIVFAGGKYGDFMQKHGFKQESNILLIHP
ncbi:GNAT family N-acetyltransferase [Candidatus Dojkabacteria bacterium]|uniref:GNAT family N-acetyltransferase n=1 Tax=Candidatus Dojkabacteria bacterium TaxID=2099670 RepID=A0A955L5R7_9BACT|nr:GNAT family N-acetyltransferase [Candidatus Dojkabacteria bacterium]